MVDNSQGKSSSQGSSIPCAQKSPEQQTSPASTGTSAHSNNLHNTLQQNVAQGQPPAANQQAFKQSPVAPQQQSSLLQPPAPGSHAASAQQGQPQFIQGQPSRQPRQPSPFRQTFNPSAQPFIPAAEAQQNNAVPNTWEPKVSKSTDGKGVKNGGPDGCLCFCCGQPGHLKNDCPLGPYCSHCNTREHTPANCPNKKGNSRMKHMKVGSSNLKKDEKTIFESREQVSTLCRQSQVMWLPNKTPAPGPSCHQSCWQYRYAFFSLFSLIFKSFTPTFPAESVYSWIVNTNIDG